MKLIACLSLFLNKIFFPFFHCLQVNQLSSIDYISINYLATLIEFSELKSLRSRKLLLEMNIPKKLALTGNGSVVRVFKA